MNGPLASTLQTFGWVGLSGLLLLEWIALRTLVQETLILKHLYEPAAEPEEAVLGTRAKRFRATLLDSSDVVSEKDLLGQMTTLLFVQPNRILSHADSMFSSLLQSIWHGRRGPVYVVCSGSREDCTLLRDTHHLGKVDNSGIDVLLDDGAALRRAFAITAALRAVVIDEKGRIAKVGGRIDKVGDARSDEHIEVREHGHEPSTPV